jgi:glycosyltransferase involved in cell wall biosynthesis
MTVDAGNRPFPGTVLAVHNRYRQFGGEDVSFATETALLEAHGHRVERFVVDNHRIDDSPTLVEAMGLAARTVWSTRAARMLGERVRTLRPDVVHVHNFFPLLSPAIFSACRREGAAVVQTLHNYRLVCPAATLYRDGGVCEDCVGRTVAWPAVLHSCYRGSAPASAAVAAMITVHRARGTWWRDIDMYIAVSEFLRGTLIRGMLDPDRIVTKSNFVMDDPGYGHDPDGPFLFLGRLAEQKGVMTLLDAWKRVPAEIHLRIVGDGPLAAKVRTEAAPHPNIEVIGPVPHDEVSQQFRAARALIFPSRSHEGGMPLAIMEAFAAGLPVIGSDIGAVSEIIDDHTNGLFFGPGDPDALAARVRWLFEHGEERAALAQGARATYLARFTPEPNYERLIEIYRAATDRRRS